ncbi:MAG TPA: hypothetical protein VFK52_09185 [Nocardioidaceae bacterium]|nr:hypothetical protein [Nocardioidaceae bacterium]
MRGFTLRKRARKSKKKVKAALSSRAVHGGSAFAAFGRGYAEEHEYPWAMGVPRLDRVKEWKMDAHDELSPNELSAEELLSETAVALPDKEVVSVIDINADLDLGIDLTAPVDLAVAANANVAAPINAAAGANVLSLGSDATAVGDQGVMIDQAVMADATATADQTSDLTGGESADDGSTTGGTDSTIDTGTSALDGSLLNVNVDLNADADVTAPINGAVAANANVAAPINAGVAANIGSIDSSAVSVAEQDAIINQTIEGSATAEANQDSEITP